MSDLTENKTCPLCAETIKAAAKVCPYCQASQKRFALWRKDFLPLLSAVLFTAFLGAVCIWVFPDDVAPTGASFSRHREDLQVLHTSLERSKKKPEYWLTGCVTNSGGYPWRVRELELRFLDTQGHLLDVRHPDVSEAFVVQPRGEAAFHVGLGELVFTNSGVAHQVRVQSATDGNLPAKPDQSP